MATWAWSRASATWLLLGVIPLLFFQTAIHETSHCLMMSATGLGCRVTAPFAVSFVSGGGAYGVTIPISEDETIPLPISMIIAPQIVAALLIIGLRLVAPRVSDERIAVLARLWLLGACVDLLNNTLSRGGGGDWSTMASELGLSSAQRLAVTLPMWAIAAWGLFAPLAARPAWGRAKLRDFWQIGVVYALISALAVCVSLTVEVPTSDPTTLWHRVPILLQTAWVVVCLAAVAASRLTRREAA